MASLGRRVTQDTLAIRTADPSVIGTTGMNPQIAVPPGVRVTMSIAPIVQKDATLPGGGAGTIA